MGFRPTGSDLFGLFGLSGLWPAGKDVADGVVVAQPHGNFDRNGFLCHHTGFE